jgi:hypothetical protein
VKFAAMLHRSGVGRVASDSLLQYRVLFGNRNIMLDIRKKHDKMNSAPLRVKGDIFEWNNLN